MFIEQRAGNIIPHFTSPAPLLSATKLPPFFSEFEYCPVIQPRALDGRGELYPPVTATSY
jgi:hypothetical protein